MAKLVYGMMQSLDGYVAGTEDGPKLPPPGEALHWYWNARMREVAGSLYGRRMYEVMSYWDEEMPDAPEVERDFALAWRAKPKWVASRTLQSVGPNATLLKGELRDAVERLKASHIGEIEVAGPELAASLTALGLIDEYRLYFVPVVLGGGKPFFAGGVGPELELIGTEVVADRTAVVRYRRR